jgi:hypothetical protein
VRAEVRRLVLAAFVRPPSRRCREHPRHRDGNPLNAHLRNLYWGPAEHRKGWQRGLDHPNVRISPQVAMLVKQAVAQQEHRQLRVIAQRYGVSHATVVAISADRVWRYL